MKVISGIWKIKKAYYTNFIVLGKEASIQSKKEIGNISFNFSEIKAEQNTFLFFEEWKNQEAIDFHISQDYFKEFMKVSKKMLQSTPIITIYDIHNQTKL
ncbi:putative quinol monooxygenase [uncultured Maribacter sp.]|uniref:putative quinol monooxygenase n=1 Tax=uncultured Maribacter sp. TaxID=431308 RepID=UPI0026349430|nr:putative quinol monooxygenase [uncultured Maribacter sp.]